MHPASLLPRTLIQFGELRALSSPVRYRGRGSIRRRCRNRPIDIAPTKEPLGRLESQGRNQGLLQRQVLLDEAGFSPGPIDGRAGSFANQSHTRLSAGERTDRHREAGRANEAGPRPRRQAGNGGREARSRGRRRAIHLSNAERARGSGEAAASSDTGTCSRSLPSGITRLPKRSLHSTAPDKLIGVGQTLTLPNVVPSSRDYSGANPKQEPLLAALNVEASQPQGDYVVVDKSEGTLKVYEGDFPSGTKPAGKLIAQFPVTTGSGHDPLPLGNWKATDLFVPSPVQLSAGPVLGRFRRQGRTQSFRQDRTEWSGSPGSI